MERKVKPWSANEIKQLIKMHNANESLDDIAVALDRSYMSINKRLTRLAAQGRVTRSKPDETSPNAKLAQTGEGCFAKSDGDNGMLVTLRSKTLRTLDALLDVSDVDAEVWEVERWLANKWDVVARVESDSKGKLAATELWQVKAWFRRKKHETRTMELLINELKSGSPLVPEIPRPRKSKKTPKRALEICIMDPHLGLNCFQGESGHNWSLDECEKFYMWAVEGLLEKAEAFGPFDEILWIFGNDYLHVDTVFHTTTQGTPQPEAESWHYTYARGVQLALAAGDKMKQVAPLRILQVPGNHDRQSSYTLGWVLWAYYHNDKNVTVDHEASPYKFWQWGKNLIGFDHGHTRKTERLASLMANECREAWAETSYREWHLGDQHRKGSGRPTMMSEQGVGVEFITGLTPANAWSKIKTFNHQVRGAVGYVWDAESGPEARLHLNVDLYTGQPMGGW